MKMLTVLSLVQIVAIVFLYSKLTDIDNNMNLTAPAAEQSPVGNLFADSQSQSNPPVAYLYPDEDRLRQIIREELGAQLDGQAATHRQMDPVIAPGSAEYAELEYQRELVSQQLEYYSSIGSITDTEMAKLQTDIAKLDATSRTEMLRQLVGAVNSGRLEGRL